MRREVCVLRKLALSAIAALAVSGCERDLPFEPTASDQPISGYRIEGYVTDRLGVPLKNIRIALWYDLDLLDDTTRPSRSLYVDDASKTVLYRALDLQNRVVKIVFNGKATIGELDYFWDYTDSVGRKVPSGVYTLEFRLDGQVRNSYHVLVNGAITAVTDSLGHYVISNDNLPIEFYPVPLYGSDNIRFLGNYRITPYIGLDFNLDITRRATVTLTKDVITRYDFRT